MSLNKEIKPNQTKHLIYLYKGDLALNKPTMLICHKTKPFGFFVMLITLIRNFILMIIQKVLTISLRQF